MDITITVDEAILQGRRMVSYPTLIIFIATLGICFYLGIQKILPFWIIPAGFGFALALAGLWWSIMITKWRLWAFENVRNVHELQKRAFQEKLIWPDRSIIEMTAIRSAKDNERWKAIQARFAHDDIFQDDSTIPMETIIYYSKKKNFFEMVVMLCCFGTGIYLLLETEGYIIGSVFTIAGAYLGFKEYKEATNTEPQIILNDKGIKTIKTEFFEWGKIKNEEAISKGSGSNVRYYLVYDHPNGSECLRIDNYDTDMSALNKLLMLYRGRSILAKQKTQQT